MKLLKPFLSLVFLANLSNLSATNLPDWVEADSLTAIQRRIASDFSLPWDEGIKQFSSKYSIDEQTLNEWEAKNYIETRNIEGKKYIHRKSLRNAALLNPELNDGWTCRGSGASSARIAYVDSIISYVDGVNPKGKAHKVTYRFSIDVPYEDWMQGDTLRVWLPYPFATQRQSDIKLISTSQPEFVLSGDRSVHNSIYFEKPVKSKETTHFDYVAEFVTLGEYFSPEFILENIQPYDTAGQVYKEYTKFESPHIVLLDSLAKSIVGEETNPYLQSELIFNYIVKNYPWAGAREYSTIECIPEYVLETGHGDCGQVSLLYISLMRSLGVPARWESGWMLHPGEKNLHDWAEVYFEGIGWVPVDVSFGRYINAPDKRVQNFYSTGMDAHRFATNKGVCGAFYPPKKYVRSETVDAQLGEVECSKGNIFYPGWNQRLELIEVKPIEL